MSIQIFILSKLMEGNKYPYQLKKQLSEPIPFDEIGELTESKLYYHFDTLAKKGFIEAVEVIKEEHRPDKQVFRITDRGREELPKLIYKLFENTDRITNMVVSLANIKYVDRGKVVEILDKKLNHIKVRWEQVKGFEKHVQISNDNANLIEFLSGFISTEIEHKIYWLEKLIKQIKQGEI